MNKISMSPVGFVGLAIVFVALIAGAYWIGVKTKPDATDPMVVYAEQFETYQNNVVSPMLLIVDSLRQITVSTKLAADRAQVAATKQTVEITRLRSAVSVLRQQNVVLADSVNADSTLPVECDQCRRAVAELSDEVDTLNEIVVQQEVRDTTRIVAINQLNVGLFAASARGDSLQRVIINFPAPRKPNKFLGVTLPEIPAQYLIVGGVLGAGILIVR